MKPTNEQLEAYKAMAAASPDSMKAKIEANLRATCDKFPGHEDSLEDCMEYLTECARGILNGKNGEVDDETCYRICRDYFNDELWKEEPKKEPKKKAEKPVKKTAEQVEKETVAKERERIEKIKEKHSAKAEKPVPEKPAQEAPKAPEKTPEQLIAEKNRAIVEENNSKMGISMAKPIDMFAEAV